jgi:MFS family permease
MIREYVRILRSFSPNARRYLVATGLVGVAIGFQYLIFNLYILSLGYDQAFVGLLASLPPLASAGLAIPVGLIIPRVGYRMSLLAGIVSLGLALLGWTLFSAPSALIGSCVLWGVGTSLLLVTAPPLIVSVAEEESRTHLFSVQYALNTLVGVVANLLGGHLPRLLASGLGQPLESPIAYRAVLMVGLVLAVAAIIPVIRLRAIRQSERTPIQAGHLIDHRRTLGGLIAVQLTVALGAGMLMPFVNVFYKLRFGLPDPALGTLFSISSLTVGLSSLIAPLIVGRMGKVHTIVVTQALSLPFLAVMGCSSLFALSASGFLIRTVLMNMSTPVFSAFSMALVPEPLRAMTASLLMLAWNGGWATSAWLSGRIQVGVGFSPLFLITGVLYIAVVVMTYFLFRNAEGPRE